jgi:hypothetical protein
MIVNHQRIQQLSDR